MSSFSVGKISHDWAEKSQIATWYAQQTASTNLIAKEGLAGLAPISLYVTDHQTAGRGRGSNSWSDSAENGSAFLSSWVFQLSKPPQPVLAPAIGLALWTALSASFPWLSWSLKAPNDLFLNGKKVAGILIENIQQGPAHRLIIGLGLNIRNTPSNVPDSISLSDLLGQDLTETAWINVLDRLLLEMSLAVSQTRTHLSETQCHGLLYALNRFPQLTAPYEKVDTDGSLWVAGRKINWSEL